MNQKILSLLIFTFLLFVSVFSAQSADFYVSIMGNDSNPGTIQNPFLTLEKAQKAVLQNTNENCTVWLSDGFYLLNEPLKFAASKFGGRNSTLTFKAENGAHPIISGGKQIKGWKRNKMDLWEADLKMENAPRELFVGEKRAVRARFPNTGYLRVKKVGEDRRTHFFFGKGDFPLPEKANDVELVLLHDWSISRIGVKDIDCKAKKLSAVDSIGAKNPPFFNLDHWEKNPRYFLENDLAFLDAEYEWYFDAENQKIFLELPANQTPKDLSIVVPISEGLVKIEGQKGKRIKNIGFEGITFQHSLWQIPEMGYCGVQACHFDSRPPANGWTVVPAAIKADWAENILFNNCAFKNLGTSGLWFATGCTNCSVANSEFTDISGNGIMIGEGRDRLVNNNAWWQESPKDVVCGNTIENCTVSDCGVQFFGAVGIWCGLTAETSIKDNEISDLPYSGISIGWMWSPVPTPCRNNVIDGNHIHNILKVLSDGGGIYMLGLQPGSKIINNNIHDVKINAGRAESNGMFLDEGTTDVIIANNLIYNIAKSPIRFHKATTNIVKENYLFCTNKNPHIRYNRTNQADIEKLNNSVFEESDVDYKIQLKKALRNWVSR